MVLNEEERKQERRANRIITVHCRKWQEIRKFAISTQSCHKSHKNRSLMFRINEIAAETTKQLYLNENLPTFRIDSLFVIQFNSHSLQFRIKIVEILNSTQAYNPLCIVIIRNYVHIWTINQSWSPPGFRVMVWLNGINGSSIQMFLSGVCDSKGYVKFSLTNSMKATRQREIFKTKHIFSNMIFGR